jgi:hypothetical protein
MSLLSETYWNIVGTFLEHTGTKWNKESDHLFILFFLSIDMQFLFYAHFIRYILSQLFCNFY